MCVAIIMLPFSAPLSVSGHDLGLVMILGLFILPLAFGLLFAGARLIPLVECGVIALLEVVFGVLWVWLALNEQPSALTIAGGTAIIGAIAINAWISIREERRKTTGAAASIAAPRRSEVLATG